MTVCIAAVCTHKGSGAIAMVCDWQATYSSSGLVTKNSDLFKLKKCGRAVVMFSDVVSDAGEIIAMLTPVVREYDCKEKIEGDFDLRINHLLEGIRRAVRARKAQIVQHFLGLNYNITFEDFMREGKNYYPGDVYQRILIEIGDLSLNADLIICYADDEFPIIIRVTSDGRVSWEGNYVCIGGGSSIAHAILCQEEYDEGIPLMDCMLRIYSAKHAAQRDPFVSPETAFWVMQRNKEHLDVSWKGWGLLKTRHKEIVTDSDLPFDESYLCIRGQDSEEVDEETTATETTISPPVASEVSVLPDASPAPQLFVVSGQEIAS